MTATHRSDDGGRANDKGHTLTRWNPLILTTGEDSVTRASVTFDGEPPSGTMLVDLPDAMGTPRNLATLYRAAEVNGLLGSLFTTDTGLDGQSWYERLARIVAMDTETMVDGEKMAFTWTDDQAWKDEGAQQLVEALRDEPANGVSEWTTVEIGENAVAEYIVVRLLVRTEYETQRRRLRTDFGVGTEFTSRVHEAGILVSRDCALDVESLQKLIAEAVYDEDEENDGDDSPQTR